MPTLTLRYLTQASFSAHLTVLCITLCADICIASEYSTNITGTTGLNAIPSARMNHTGTIEGGVATLSPYFHGYIGIQVAEPLSITLRQTAETSDITDNAEKLYPGIDFKLRLLHETRYRPEIAIGVQSAIGHRRMAGEYIALSKRYKNFDFTAGLGWGRFGSAGHIKNPFKAINSHFGKTRHLDGDNPNTPARWFTGEDIGIFGGVEYFLPYEGLSIKFDYGADRYRAEALSGENNTPSPWGIGLSYRHDNTINAAIGAHGTDTIMARLSLRSNPMKWPFQHESYTQPKPFYNTRSPTENITAIYRNAEQDGIILDNIATQGRTLSANIHLPHYANSPQTIGRALRHISTHSGASIESFRITPYTNNLQGTTMNILRKDVERTMGQEHASADELWQSTEFITAKRGIKKTAQSFVTLDTLRKNTEVSLHLENQFSLSEEDSGILYRSSIIGAKHTPIFMGLSTSAAFRINLHDNLNKLATLRAPVISPVRSDVDLFTQRRITLEHSYLGYNKSLTPDLHADLRVGHLEEFYGGAGGEILYRPFNKRFALGAEAWRVMRRSPYTTFNAGFTPGHSEITAHFNGWYTLPKHNITLNTKVGRFLGGDTGFLLGVEKIFDNGAILKGDMTLTDRATVDPYGGTTHAYHRLSLNLPLGSSHYLPNGSTLKTITAPFGSDVGQTLELPRRLYDTTHGLSLKHIAHHWHKIND